MAFSPECTMIHGPVKKPEKLYFNGMQKHSYVPLGMPRMAMVFLLGKGLANLAQLPSSYV